MIIAHCLRVHLYGVAGYDIAGRLAERVGLAPDAEVLAILLAEEERVVERLGALEPEIFNTAAV